MRWLTDKELVEVVDALPRAPLGPTEDLQVRASLAGTQGKLAVVLDAGRIGLPRGGAPSTHILKPQWRPGPDDPQWHDLVANEAFCMRLAAAAGFSAAKVRPSTVGNRPVLVVERFDREEGPGGARRIHQEDLAQAAGVPPRMKYEEGGGPSLVRLAETLRRAGAPAVEALPALLDAITVAAATGNADQHAKNLAIVYAPNGTRLAPLYDLVSTVMYHDLTKIAALKVGGVTHVGEIGVEACLSEARSWRMPERQARERLGRSVERLHAAVDTVLVTAVAEGWACPVVDEIAELVRTWPKRTD